MMARWVMRLESRGTIALLYAVVISAILSCLYAGSRGFGGAQELEANVSEGEEAKMIKSSLRQIGSRLLSQDRRNRNRLGETDRDQLGALVDAAVARQSSKTLIEGAGAWQRQSWSAGGRGESGSDLLRWVDQAGEAGGSRSSGGDDGSRFWESSERSRAASPAKGCGSSCLETLGDRLGGVSKAVGGGHMSATTEENAWEDGVAEHDMDGGPKSVGAERLSKSVEQQDSESDRAKFIAAQHQKMKSAVKAGWKELNQGHTGKAKESLRQAKFFHRAMLHLMQGSAKVADHLGTPQEIRELRDAIYSSSADKDVTPSKLEKIMDAHYPPSPGDMHDERGRGDHVSRHFAGDTEQSDGAGGAWDAGRKQAIEIPQDRKNRDSASSIISLATKNLEGRSKTQKTSRSGDSNVVSFEALLKSQIKHGKHALGKLDTHMAEKALEKASVYLSTLEDMGSKESGGHNDGDKQRTASLQLEFQILRHAVDNARGSRERGRREQLDRNMQALHAPIQHLSVAQYALGSGGEGGGSRDRTRGLFTKSVEKGIKAANLGDVVVAQGKLGEAKEYAKIDGYLKPSWEQVSSSDASRARMAQRSLKLLAQAVIAAERVGGHEGGRDDGRGEDRFRGERGMRGVDRSSAKNWESMYSSDARLGQEANGEREESSLSDQRARQGERGVDARRRGRRGAPRSNLADSVSSHSATYREANGESEETRWRNKRAKRREKERCNTLSCLFGLGTGTGGRQTSSRRGGGIDDRLHFGSKATHMHTGLGISRRLQRSGSKGAEVPENLEDRKKAMGLSGASPGSPASKWASQVDAVKLVDSQDKADLSKSMQEAKLAYKRLLRHEVKKEQQRVISGPMMAIESPTGGSVVADTGKEASRVLHSSKLTRDMDASDAFKKAPSTHKRIGKGAEALINTYLGESKLGKLPAARKVAPRRHSMISARTDAATAHASLGLERAERQGTVQAAATRALPEPVVDHTSVTSRKFGAERQGGDERVALAKRGRHERVRDGEEDDGPEDSLGGMLIRDLGKDLGLDG